MLCIITYFTNYNLSTLSIAKILIIWYILSRENVISKIIVFDFVVINSKSNQRARARLIDI